MTNKILVYSIMMLNIFIATGWIHLSIFNKQFTNKLYRLGYSCLTLYFMGQSFMAYNTYIIHQNTVFIELIIPRLLFLLMAAAGTIIIVYTSNFYNQ